MSPLEESEARVRAHVRRNSDPISFPAYLRGLLGDKADLVGATLAIIALDEHRIITQETAA